MSRNFLADGEFWQCLSQFEIKVDDLGTVKDRFL